MTDIALTKYIKQNPQISLKIWYNAEMYILRSIFLAAMLIA